MVINILLPTLYVRVILGGGYRHQRAIRREVLSPDPLKLRLVFERHTAFVTFERSASS